jgi:hypothetical protein
MTAIARLYEQALVLAVEVAVEGASVVHVEARVAVSVREEGAVGDRDPPAKNVLDSNRNAASSCWMRSRAAAA